MTSEGLQCQTVKWAILSGKARPAVLTEGPTAGRAGGPTLDLPAARPDGYPAFQPTWRSSHPPISMWSYSRVTPATLDRVWLPSVPRTMHSADGIKAANQPHLNRTENRGSKVITGPSEVERGRRCVREMRHKRDPTYPGWLCRGSWGHKPRAVGGPGRQPTRTHSSVL